MEESLPIRSSLPRRGRLIKSASYGVVLSSRGPKTVRLSSRWLTLTALLKPESETGERLRFGFTVGKANAHRGVDRATAIERIVKACQKNPSGIGKTLQACIGAIECLCGCRASPEVPSAQAGRRCRPRKFQAGTAPGLR